MNIYGTDSQPLYWEGGTTYDYTKDQFGYKIKSCQTKKEDDGKVIKGVYDVYIFDKQGELLKSNENVLATSEEEAKYEAGVYNYLRLYNYSLSDVIVKMVKKFSIDVIEKEEEGNSMVAGTD